MTDGSIELIMTIEFTIDELRQHLRSGIVRGGAEEILHQEARKIMEKHRKAMIDDLDKLITSFSVHCVSDPVTGISKIKITLPDA